MPAIQEYVLDRYNHGMNSPEAEQAIVEADALDRIAVIVNRARSNARAAQLRARQPQGATSGDIALFAQNAGDAAEDALEILLQMGAKRRRPTLGTAQAPLALMDTPATRRLHEVLAEAARAAAAVDRERGWIDPDGRPVCWGDTLAGMERTLRNEVFGPEGRD